MHDVRVISQSSKEKQKVNENILIDYWNFLVWNFSRMGNTAFFWDKKLVERWYLLIAEMFLFWNLLGWKIRSFWGKKLMERWYLLVTEKFFFWTVLWWEIRSFFGGKKLKERWYLLMTEKFLFSAFQWWELRSFYWLESWCESNIYLAFMSFPWYSRTWDIRFFVQCLLCSLQLSIVFVF